MKRFPGGELGDFLELNGWELTSTDVSSQPNIGRWIKNQFNRIVRATISRNQHGFWALIITAEVKTENGWAEFQVCQTGLSEDWIRGNLSHQVERLLVAVEAWEDLGVRA